VKLTGPQLIRLRWQKNPPEKRFWEKVNKRGPNDCWLWTGATAGRGYGFLRIKGKRVQVTKFAHELFKGPVPKGMMVCHTCDNPPCVNPAHLFAGTSLDNVRDCIEKGRAAANASRLRAKDIPRIRVLDSMGETQREIARLYGVDQSTISHVLDGSTWGWVK
jgi:predicted XRE-type DNA-binding protein